MSANKTLTKSAKPAKDETKKTAGKLPEASDWKAMIEEFRALGGTADNVEQRIGDLGRGVFAIDPSKPIRITVPDNLLMKVPDLEFIDGKLCVKKDADVPERVRVFFEEFEEKFSWGLGGREGVDEFFERVDALPENVRDVLVKDMGLTGLGVANKSADRTQRRFLRSRMLSYKGGHVMMPVLELVNHGIKGCPFKVSDGVTIDGTFDGEAFAHYGMVDPFGAFEVWGFASNEPVAFSLPATLNLGTRKLIIARQLSNKKVRGNFRIPVLEENDNQIRISHLMLGHARFPRLAKGIFYQFVKEFGGQHGEALFDQIRRFNIQQFLKLMEALDEHEGPLISTLRRLCRHQISAITNSIGSREI